MLYKAGEYMQPIVSSLDHRDRIMCLLLNMKLNSIQIEVNFYEQQEGTVSLLPFSFTNFSICKFETEFRRNYTIFQDT